MNADGHVDLLAITRDPNAENVFHCNRGYGSYILSELYMDYGGLPGKSFASGAWGVAAGDVNDDGLTDLLFGVVPVFVNTGAALRPPFWLVWRVYSGCCSNRGSCFACVFASRGCRSW